MPLSNPNEILHLHLVHQATQGRPRRDAGRCVGVPGLFEVEKRGGGGGAAGGQGETAGSKSSLLHIRSAVRVPHRDVLLGFVESEVACLTPKLGSQQLMAVDSQ